MFLVGVFFYFRRRNSQKIALKGSNDEAQPSTSVKIEISQRMVSSYGKPELPTKANIHELEAKKIIAELP